MINSKDISFITFGGQSIGTGHIYRCLAIAEWIEQVDLNINISFYLYNSDQDSIRVSKQIIQNHRSCQVKLLDDLSLQNEKWEIVIVDLLDAPLKMMRYLHNVATRTISIDNISESRFLSDIAINPLYYDAKCNNQILKPAYDFIGPEYQIISPKFKNTQNNPRTKIDNILIIQGGADPFNLVEKIYFDVCEILSTYPNLSLHIVTGPAAKKSKLVKKLEFSERIFFYHNVKNMPKLLKNIDLAISSVGITAFELAFMGIPAIHVTAIEKELQTAVKLNDIGVSIYLGLYKGLKIGMIYNQLELLLEDNLLFKKLSMSALETFNNNNINKMINLIIE